MNRADLAGGRAQLRLPVSPARAEMALRALDEWRQPEPAAGRVRAWYAIANHADGTPTQVNIFDEISWWGVSADEFCADLAKIDGPIELHINSPGGDAFDGITIYNALASRGNVTTVVDGLAASAASVIAMAGSPRVMSPGSMMMIHDALALCIGNAADMRDCAGLLDKVSNNIADVYAAHAGKTAADWRAAMTGEGWFTAQEAVDAGLAHKVAERPAAAGGAEPAVAARWDRSVFAAWQGNVSAAAADESAWDAAKAWANGAASDDPAAFYNGICAGKKAGDPATQAAHALPHHYHPGDAPNRHGVTAALGRIGSTDGLTNKAAAQAHLDAHKAAMGSGGADDKAAAPAAACGDVPAWLTADGSPDDGAGDLPAWLAKAAR